jgi:hypothetical protein
VVEYLNVEQQRMEATLEEVILRSLHQLQILQILRISYNFSNTTLVFTQLPILTMKFFATILAATALLTPTVSAVEDSICMRFGCTCSLSPLILQY